MFDQIDYLGILFWSFSGLLHSFTLVLLGFFLGFPQGKEPSHQRRNVRHERDDIGGGIPALHVVKQEERCRIFDDEIPPQEKRQQKVASQKQTSAQDDQCDLSIFLIRMTFGLFVKEIVCYRDLSPPPQCAGKYHANYQQG